jgi:hypothetical protein
MDQNIETVVKQLKANGYRISTIHYRRINKDYTLTTPTGKFVASVPVDIPLFEARRIGKASSLISKGGYTTVRLSHREKEIDITGVAKCHDHDYFLNKLGFRKALFAAVDEAKSKGIILE